jgi:hypothetical protein
VLPPASLSRELVEDAPLLTLVVLMLAAVLVHELVRWVWGAIRRRGGHTEG